jgi:hypothetical protein
MLITASLQQLLRQHKSPAAGMEVEGSACRSPLGILLVHTVVASCYKDSWDTFANLHQTLQSIHVM